MEDRLCSNLDLAGEQLAVLGCCDLRLKETRWVAGREPVGRGMEVDKSKRHYLNFMRPVLSL